jgi:hypothetical protein
MSLDWSVAKVKDFETVCKVGEGEDRRWNPVTEGLVWLLMAIGQRAITEKNKDKVWDRIQKWEKIHGPMLFAGPGNPPWFITKEDVEKHVGLSTNVSDKSDAVFKRELAEDALEIALKK